MAGQTAFGSDEPECLDNCYSIQHGREICGIASVSGGIDAVPLWVKKCANYAQVQDEFGRTALHLVASTGNIEALEWLIKRAGANLDKKDKISGHTALHRSIYYGNIHSARSLIKFGSDIHQKDNEGMTAFELCNKEIKDLQRGFHANIESDPTELLVWGTNDNYTLGNVNKQERLVPEQLEVFRKHNTQIMKAVMSTYHSVFLSQMGEIFVCGSGRLGILGNGYDKPVLHVEQLQIRSSARCTSIAAGQDHTLFLMENGRVLSCGSNEFGISGQKEAIKQLLIPKTVEFPGKVCIEGIIGARYHSVFYTSHKLFTCGLNRGQLGHSQEKGPVVYEPKLISQISWDAEGDTKFTHFAASACATVARASTGIIYVLHKFDVIKINAKQFDVVKLQVVGGSFCDTHFDKSTKFNSDEHLVVLLLTSTGRIIVWRAKVTGHSCGIGTFSRVIFNNFLDIADFSLSQSCLVFITTCGEAYKSVWKPLGDPSYVALPCWQRQRDSQQITDFQISTGSRRPQKGKDPSSVVSFLEHVKIQKIKNVYSALFITSDEQGKNFSIIQSSPKTQLTSLPVVSTSHLHLDMLKVLDEASEEDGLHDVILKVGSRRFAAHLFIIASGCPKLHSMIVSKLKRKVDNEAKILALEDFDDQVFGQILQFIYSHTCDLLTMGKHLANFRVSDIMKSTIEAARRLELENLCKALRKFIIIENVVNLKPSECPFEIPPRRFIRNVHENLCDIKLQSQDLQVFTAHQCVLVARSEYFYSMLFANVWLEHASQKPIQMQFSGQCIEIFLEYIYEDTISNLPSNDFDALSEILAMSDNLFLNRLRSLVESALAEILSLKNIASMFYLADRCNALQLKETCMQFIAVNLPLVLETRLLDPLPLDLVKDVSVYYRQIHPSMTSRRITRPSTAPSELDFEQGMIHISPELANEIEALQYDDEVRRPQIKSTKNKARIRSRASESEHLAGLNTSGNFLNLSQDLDISSGTSALASPSSCHHSKENDKVQVLPLHRKFKFPNPSQTMSTLKIAEAQETLKNSQKLNPTEFPSLNTNTKSSDVWSPLPKQIANYQKNSADSVPDIVLQKVPLSSISLEISSNGRKSCPSHEQTNLNHKSGGATKRKTKWKSVDLNNVSNSEQSSNPNLVVTKSPSLPSRDPQNPWKVEDTSKKVEFKEIVQDEMEKKQNWERATTKALHLMQIEDQAINQLTARYHSADVEEGIEIISVERVCSTNFAPPTWVQHSPFNRNN